MPLSRITSTSFANNAFPQSQGLITGTANGAITIGKGVLINPDNSFTQLVGTNYAAGNTVSIFSGSGGYGSFDSFINGSGDQIRFMSILGDPRSTSNAVMIYGTSASSDSRVRSIWVDPNNPAVANYGVPTTLTVSTSPGQTAELVWHNANNLFLCISFEGNNTLGVRTVNVAVGNTVTVGTSTTVGTIYESILPSSTNYANVGSIAAFHDSSTSRTLIGCYDSSTRYPQVLVANVSGATITFGAKTVIESVQGPTGAGTVAKMYGCFDPTSNKSVFLYTASSFSRMNLVVATTDASSNTVTLGTPITLPRCNAALHFGITANPNTGKVVIASSNLIYEYSVTGTTLTLEGTFDSPYSTVPTDIYSNGLTKLNYDIVTQNYTGIGFARSQTTVGQAGPYGITFKKNKVANSYVMLSYTSPSVEFAGTTTASRLRFTGSAFTKIGSSNNYILGAFSLDTTVCGTGSSLLLDISTIPNTSDYNSGTFVGYAANTYTNGQTASVYYANGGGLLISNSLNIRQGAPYFIDFTNTLIDGSANTINMYKIAGRAISNNQLIIG